MRRLSGSSTTSSTFRATRLPQQAREARAKRRIGLGVTGLADALIFLGASYGSAAAREKAASWMAIIQNAAYRASAALAAEKGAFPLYDAKAFLARPNIARLDADVRDAIAANGIRNGCLTSIAPTGTISLLAANVSSGIEPVFDFVYRRRVLGDDQAAEEQTVEDFAHRKFRETFGARRAVAGGFRNGRGPDAVSACRDAGGAAAVRRQRHFEDDQLPGRHQLREFSRHLHRGL